ncbi:MAG: SGNH/GDSL hydrolase family protein, partial [Dehalococcoidia bacterium]
MRTFAAALSLLLLLAVAGASAQTEDSGPLYLALGDSLAAGVGASDRAAKGYVPLIHRHLQETPRWRERDLGLLNLSVPGETTASMMAPGGQLEQATGEIARRNGDADPNSDVEVITIDIGANDLLDLLLANLACALNPDEPECQTRLQYTLALAAANVRTIFRQLRTAAGPDAIIIVMTYYNPFSGTGLPLEQVADEAVAELNVTIVAAAGAPEVKALVADVFPLFAGKAPQLTHITQLPPDVHPNDTGYALIAEALVAALSPTLEATPTPASAPIT